MMKPAFVCALLELNSAAISTFRRKSSSCILKLPLIFIASSLWLRNLTGTSGLVCRWWMRGAGTIRGGRGRKEQVKQQLGRWRLGES